MQRGIESVAGWHGTEPAEGEMLMACILCLCVLYFSLVFLVSYLALIQVGTACAGVIPTLRSWHRVIYLRF